MVQQGRVVEYSGRVEQVAAVQRAGAVRACSLGHQNRLRHRSGRRRGLRRDRRAGLAPAGPPHAAQRDAAEDGRAPGQLGRASRVTEDHDARHRADQRLDVEERPGDLGRQPALPEGEQA